MWAMRRRVIIPLVFGCGMVTAATSSLLGQSNRLIPIVGAPTCKACAIKVERTAVLRAPPAAGNLARSAVVLDSAGRFYVVSEDRQTLMAFSPAGQLLWQYARHGFGPGEIRAITATSIGPGDSIYVVDDSRRLSVFGPGFKFGRVEQLPAATSGFVVNSDRTITALMAIRTPSKAGYNVHLVKGGDVVRSFGQAREPTLDRRCRACSQQRMSPGPKPQTVWVFSANRYLLELWNSKGTVEQTLSVSGSTWYQEWDSDPPMAGENVRQVSTVLTVASDTGGMVWVGGIHSPASVQPRGLPAGVSRNAAGGIVGTREGVAEYLAQLQDSYSESVIDIVSTEQRNLVATARLPGTVQLLGASTGYRFLSDADGNTLIEILRLSLHR